MPEAAGRARAGGPTGWGPRAPSHRLQRRLYHMQQHTGQHLLSAVLEQDYGIHSSRSTSERSTAPSMFRPKIRRICRSGRSRPRSTGGLKRDVPVRVHYCPPEDLSAFRLRKRPPATKPSSGSSRSTDTTGRPAEAPTWTGRASSGRSKYFRSSGTRAVCACISRRARMRSNCCSRRTTRRGGCAAPRRGGGRYGCAPGGQMEKASSFERKAKRCAQQRAEAEAKLAIAEAGRRPCSIQARG